MQEYEDILNSSAKSQKELETVSSEESRTKYLSLGNSIAIGYIKDRVVNLLAKVSHYDTSIRGYLTRGILETLVRSISIPLDSRTKHYSIHSMKGILTLIGDQTSVKKVLGEINALFADYETAMQQNYTQLKIEFAIKLDESSKVLEQQLGARVEFNADRQSQFREEWRKISSELNAIYGKMLDSYKQNLLIELQREFAA